MEQEFAHNAMPILLKLPTNAFNAHITVAFASIHQFAITTAQRTISGQP